MTRTARLLFLALLTLGSLTGAVATSSAASAAVPFSLQVTPVSDTVAVGEVAAFRIRVEGQTESLPSFSYDVEGGTLAGVASIDPVAANVAEGTVFVSRDTAGTVRLSVRFGGEVLGTAAARFAPMGKVNVTVTLDAGPDAAARTWRFEVVSASGQVVASLSAGTSGDAPTTVVGTPSLPYGFYTVRQVLGNDTRTACASGVFYQVTAPVSGQTTLELASTAATVAFNIVPCPDLPANLDVLIPIDTIAPPAGIVGEPDVLPGETPISEVRGAREEGPGNPLPPQVGNTAPASARSHLFLLFLAGAAAACLSATAGSAVAVRGRNNS